jgi:ribosomal-protein-alanine N-acetyltransferase
MAVLIRPYEARDFAALYRLDQSCFPPGISYTKTGLRYFLGMDGAKCLVAEDGKVIAGFLLAEENRPLAHIITLDVTESHRRHGIGSVLLRQTEANLAASEVRAILLETATTNAAAIAFWQAHGYRSEAVLKRYYLGRLDAYEMRKTLPALSGTGGAGNKLQER